MEDLRVVKTKQMIKDTFLELMKTVGFEKITINQLAKKAIVNRSTFYLHYMDKYDLLNKLEDEILEGLSDILNEISTEAILKEGFGHPQPIKTLNLVFEYIKENKNFFTVIISQNGDPAFMPKLSEFIKGVIINKDMLTKLQIPESYAVAIICGIQTGVITNWIRTGMKETPSQVAAIVSTALKDVPKNIFGQ